MPTNIEIIRDLCKAIEPFAEKPSDRLKDYTCHSGIVPLENCGRCKKAIRAWNALQSAKRFLGDFNA